MNSKRLQSYLPVLSLLLAASLWGMFWYPLRMLEENGLAGLWASLLIFGGALLVGMPALWRGREEIASNFALLAAMGLASGWCNVTFFLSVLEGNVLRVLLLFYLSPVWAVILGRLILKEHISAHTIMALVAGVVGAMIMLWDPVNGWPWPSGRADWLAISSGLGFAFTNVMARKAEKVTVASKTGVAWLGAVLMTLSWIVVRSEPLPDVTLTVAFSALALGMLVLVIMTYSVFYGVSNMPVHRSSIILLFELVAGAVSAQWLADEVVQVREWVGGALIVFAAWWTAKRQMG